MDPIDLTGKVDEVDYSGFIPTLDSLIQLAEIRGDHLLAAKAQAVLDKLRVLLIKS